MYPFKPKKQIKKFPVTIGFDIETCNKNRDFVCASLVGNMFSKTFWEKKELIKELTKQKYSNTYIVATNLSFDFFGTFFGQKEISNFKMIFRGSSLIVATVYIKDGKFTNEITRRKLTFIDTMNYCNLSVEKMGKLLKFNKLEKPEFLGKKPRNEKERNIMQEYNIRDAEVTKKFTDFLFRTFYGLGADIKNTIASTAMSLFKNKYLEGVYWQPTKDQTLEMFEAYYGGRTEVFKRGKIKNKRYYDYNSLYPSVMRDNIFPDPSSCNLTYNKTDKYIMKYEGCSLVEIYQPYTEKPILPVRVPGKLIFPIGDFKGWYNHNEIRYALSVGCKLKKVHKTYYFKKTCSPFKNYVNSLYSLRLKYKKENNPMEYVVKILMNSLYGKFGQRFKDRDNLTPFNHTLDELLKFKHFEHINGFLRTKQDCMMSNFCFPIWAGYITSYARIKMHKLLVKSKAVYCDTDSVITDQELESSTQLGGLKEEFIIDEGWLIRPKFYGLKTSVGDIVKCKGLPVKMDYEEFDIFLDNPNKTFDKFVRPREALRRKLLPNEIIEGTKCFSLHDDKRVYTEEFNKNKLIDTQPINMIDLPG